MPHAVRCLVLASLVIMGAAAGAIAQSANDTASGRRVDFTLTPFRDTLFTAIDGGFRARFDDNGHIWYTTEGGLVHVDPFNQTRELYTKMEGLPSSLSLGLDVEGRHVYVGTDLGLGIVDRVTGTVRGVTPLNSPLPDQIVQDVTVVGTDLWLGTRFFGVAIWDTTKDVADASAWTFKNTSTAPDHAKAVRSITPTPSAVLVATEGDGLWRYDRATRTWNVTLKDDGLPTSEVLSAVERDGEIWAGTTKGLAHRQADGKWRIYNKTHGMPHDRVVDLDVIPTANGTRDIFASTPKGLWQLDVTNGANVTLAQNFGILGNYILDNEFVPTKGWLFATQRGVSMRRGGEWHYYATGPTSGPSWGPLSYGMTSASVGDGQGYLWFGSSEGLSAYRLPAQGQPGFWMNFGPWQNYPGSVVNWIDTNGNITWFGTNQGTYGFEHDTGRWIPKIATNSRNLVYGIEADGDELWVALFGDGLIMENLKTGLVRSWSHETALARLPDVYLTDVRVDGNEVWVGAGAGLIRLARDSGTLRGTYTTAEGLPGGGVVFRVIPEGPTVWVGTKDGGVAKFDVASGKVSRVWNGTTQPGFPGGQVRSLHREGDHLWVGTTEGLARIHIGTGQWRAWDQHNSDLVQNFVNGITNAGGLLYIATLSGVQRFDLDKNEFLPMRDGPGVVRASIDDTPTSSTRVTVTIEAPRAGGAVVGVEQVRGRAFLFGGTIDRVEWRAADGAWTRADGTEAWTFDWDTTTLPAEEPVTLTVRAFSGEIEGQSSITVTPIAAPEVPLTISEPSPPTEAYANRSLRLVALVSGDEPLSARVFYQPSGASGFERLPMERQGDFFSATIPARAVREGEMRYYLEAQSGTLQFATTSGDAYEPTRLRVLPAPRLAVGVEPPVLVEANAGLDTPFTLKVTNLGTERASFTLTAAGSRSSWVSVPPETLALDAGETREVQAVVVVPQNAFSDNTTLTFEARDVGGVAEPASASVPLRIVAKEAPPTPTPEASPEQPASRVPLHPAVALVAVALALVLRRRSS